MGKFIPLAERLETHRRVTANGCWEWTARRDSKGYGQIRIGRRVRTVSRVSYELKFGELPREIFVCHRCDNPACFNPDHLFTGTQKDNLEDMKRKGRHKGKGGFHKLNPGDKQVIKASKDLGLDAMTVARLYNITKTYVQQIWRGYRG